MIASVGGIIRHIVERKDIDLELCEIESKAVGKVYGFIYLGTGNEAGLYQYTNSGLAQGVGCCFCKKSAVHSSRVTYNNSSHLGKDVFQMFVISHEFTIQKESMSVKKKQKEYAAYCRSGLRVYP